jgi:hypothetical protein
MFYGGKEAGIWWVEGVLVFVAKIVGREEEGGGRRGVLCLGLWGPRGRK